jgi:hypothetical protein
VRAHNSATVFGELSDADYGYTTGKAYDIVRVFGKEGTHDDEFGFIPLISIDNTDMLYLVDQYQSKIKKFSVDGTYQGLLKSNVDSQAPAFFGNETITSQGQNLVIDDNGQPKANVATGVNINGQMTVDNNGNIYFPTDWSPVDGFDHHRIYSYDINGNYLGNWGTKGTGEGQLSSPWGVSFYKDNIVVTCQENPRAQFFSTSGQYIRSIDFSSVTSVTYGNFLKDDVLYVAAGAFVIKTDLDGKFFERIGEGVVGLASSVVVDSSGNVIVTDPYMRKIYVFNTN